MRAYSTDLRTRVVKAAKPGKPLSEVARTFGVSVSLAVTAGCHSDCNGATAGWVLAALRGRECLPEKLLTPLDGRLQTIVVGNTYRRFADLAERIASIAVSVPEG